MAKVEGLERVLDALDKRGTHYRDGYRVIVGYGAPYAIYVHENLQARHPVGQAKFLEEPARMHAKEVRKIVAKALAKGSKPGSALALGGNHLLRISKSKCPVDTSFMRESGYVEVLGP